MFIFPRHSERAEGFTGYFPFSDRWSKLLLKSSFSVSRCEIERKSTYKLHYLWRNRSFLRKLQPICHYGKTTFLSLGYYGSAFTFVCSKQERGVHIRTYARAYSWNLGKNTFLFPERIFTIKSGWLINFSYYIGVGFFLILLLFHKRAARNVIVGWQTRDWAL